MIEALNSLDRTIAAGVLVRAALSLESDGNPAASARLAGEASLRQELIREARTRLGLAPDDNRPETVEKLGEFFDEESERLIDPPDTASALERLATRGDLASDLYEINIIPNLVQAHGRNFDLEKRLIESTVRNPSREQHYGPPTVADQPYMISLFAKEFKTPWPFKDFTMLVAGGREKLTLHVHQAWRLYPAFVDERGADLVEILHRFANVYGMNLEIDGKKDHFFLWASHILPRTIQIDMQGRSREFTVSQFTQNLLSREPQAALIVAIDLEKYRATLRQMWVQPDKIYSGPALNFPKHELTRPVG